jgi:hypothetical protein
VLLRKESWQLALPTFFYGVGGWIRFDVEETQF